MKRLVIQCTGKEIKVEAEGFTGTSCEEAVAFIDEQMALVEREHKAEFYQFDQDASQYT